MGKGFDSWIVSSFRRALSVRLIIIGTIVIIVPLIMSLLLKALTLLALVFDPTACISAADDVVQISVIPISPSVVFLRWSETAGRVPVLNLSVVKLMTPCFAVTVEGWVNHGYRIQHCLEALYVCINFFIVLWQLRSELVEEHSRGQGILRQCAVDLLPLVLDPADLISDYS
jgi:hypothetical protein